MQEAKAKREIVGKGSGRWHLIGHLQTNKAKQAVAIFDMIESADSPIRPNRQLPFLI